MAGVAFRNFYPTAENKQSITIGHDLYDDLPHKNIISIRLVKMIVIDASDEHCQGWNRHNKIRKPSFIMLEVFEIKAQVESRKKTMPCFVQIIFSIRKILLFKMKAETDKIKIQT